MNFLTRISTRATLSALSMLLAAALLAACGGGDSAPAATAGTVGCTGDALAFFTKNAGTFPSTASSFGGSGTVAGIANGSAATVVVGADCTLKVGDGTLMYKDASLSPSPGGQIDVEMTGVNFTGSTYEVYGDGTGLTSVHDTRTNSYMNFFLPKK